MQTRITVPAVAHSEPSRVADSIRRFAFRLVSRKCSERWQKAVGETAAALPFRSEFTASNMGILWLPGVSLILVKNKQSPRSGRAKVLTIGPLAQRLSTRCC